MHSIKIKKRKTNSGCVFYSDTRFQQIMIWLIEYNKIQAFCFRNAFTIKVDFPLVQN